MPVWKSNFRRPTRRCSRGHVGSMAWRNLTHWLISTQVNAVDAYKQFGDELDAAAGRRFRECVLEPGAAAGGAAMMEAFLGRPFREDAYFERLGVPVSS